MRLPAWCGPVSSLGKARWQLRDAWSGCRERGVRFCPPSGSGHLRRLFRTRMGSRPRTPCSSRLPWSGAGNAPAVGRSWFWTLVLLRRPARPGLRWSALRERQTEGPSCSRAVSGSPAAAAATPPPAPWSVRRCGPWVQPPPVSPTRPGSPRRSPAPEQSWARVLRFPCPDLARALAHRFSPAPGPLPQVGGVTPVSSRASNTRIPAWTTRSVRSGTAQAGHTFRPEPGDPETLLSGTDGVPAGAHFFSRPRPR